LNKIGQFYCYAVRATYINHENEEVTALILQICLDLVNCFIYHSDIANLLETNKSKGEEAIALLNTIGIETSPKMIKLGINGLLAQLHI
jgi:hypothetical protein